MPTPNSYRLFVIALLSVILAACNGTGETNGVGGGDSAGGDDRPLTERAERKAKDSKDASAFEEVLIETQNGSINVICADSSTVDADATIHAMGPTSGEAETLAGEIQLIAEADPNTPSRLHIRVAFPGDNAPVTQGAELSITMPKSLKVIVRAANSWVRVTGCEKDVDVRTNKAEVTVLDIAGSVRVVTQEDQITALRIAGNVDLLTVRAKIVLKEFGGKVKLKTTSAPIEIWHNKPPAPIEIEAETSGNSITCELPGTIVATLTLTAPNGQVQADDLDEDMKIEGMITSKDQVRCRINGGGEGQVELTANNGRVVFKILEFTKPANK